MIKIFFSFIYENHFLEFYLWINFKFLFLNKTFEYMSLEEKLRDFLEKGKDWERIRTTINGIFILKIPKSKIKDTPSRIVVELNPSDEFGNPTKKRGIILRNFEELKEFKNLINNEKLENLLKAIDNINPKISKRFKPSKEAIEI